MRSGGVVYYLLSDQLNSTARIVNSGGVVQSTQYFYPFGGNRGAAFSSLTTKRFTGQYHESSLTGGEGLYFYNARWYDAKLGRFVSADTLVPSPGNPQSFNRYAYVLNNPLRYTDPSGHREVDCAPGESCIGSGGSNAGKHSPQSLPNGRYLCTQNYGCFDNTHWGAGNPADFLRRLESTVKGGGGVIHILFDTVFGDYIAYYVVAGTIPSDKIVNVSLGIYTDASIRFERWEQLGVFGLGTTFAIEDLPTHYLSFVAAATNMSKEDIFSHLGPVTGTAEDPPRTLWPFGNNTSKNRQMTPRVQSNGEWVNVPWPDALTITPIDTDSNYWGYGYDDAQYTPMDALRYIWEKLR